MTDLQHEVGVNMIHFPLEIDSVKQFSVAMRKYFGEKRSGGRMSRREIDWSSGWKTTD